MMTALAPNCVTSNTKASTQRIDRQALTDGIPGEDGASTVWGTEEAGVSLVTTVDEQIKSADEAICRNIASLTDQRALLSQNVLAQLRNLVEGVSVRLHTGRSDAEFNYAAVEPGLAFAKSKAKLNFLGKFHKLIQMSASHYTLDGDASERLMLKYYEYLHRIRSLLKDSCGIAALTNLEAFPVDLDPSLREYHEKIAARIELVRPTPTSDTGGGTKPVLHPQDTPVLRRRSNLL